MKKTSTFCAKTILCCMMLSLFQPAIANPTSSRSSKHPARTSLLLKTVGFTSALVVGVPINIVRKTAKSISDSACMITYWNPSPEVAAMLPGAAACAVVACAKGFVDGCDNAASKKAFSLESYSLGKLKES